MIRRGFKNMAEKRHFIDELFKKRWDFIHNWQGATKELHDSSELSKMEKEIDYYIERRDEFK